jgi:hypothetical protein
MRQGGFYNLWSALTLAPVGDRPRRLPNTTGMRTAAEDRCGESPGSQNCGIAPDSTQTFLGTGGKGRGTPPNRGRRRPCKAASCGMSHGSALARASARLVCRWPRWLQCLRSSRTPGPSSSTPSPNSLATTELTRSEFGLGPDVLRDGNAAWGPLLLTVAGAATHVCECLGRLHTQHPLPEDSFAGHAGARQAV